MRCSVFGSENIFPARGKGAPLCELEASRTKWEICPAVKRRDKFARPILGEPPLALPSVLIAFEVGRLVRWSDFATSSGTSQPTPATGDSRVRQKTWLGRRRLEEADPSSALPEGSHRVSKAFGVFNRMKVRVAHCRLPSHGLHAPTV